MSVDTAADVVGAYLAAPHHMIIGEDRVEATRTAAPGCSTPATSGSTATESKAVYLKL